MNNGQPVQGQSTTDFFTTGAGTNIENANNFAAEDNLDKSNQDWTSPLERDQRNLGNTALNSPEMPLAQEASAETPNTVNVDQVVNIEMPPGVENEEQLVAEESIKEEAAFDEKNIKTGKRLSKIAVQEVSSVISKLKKDENVEDFYEAVRGENGMFEANMKNSYGEMATWKGNK